ncbi:MAG: GldG family protein, partial [Planctomycetes bacterium]|nr:GldG family protein [Planctomycetota bacterium]
MRNRLLRYGLEVVGLRTLLALAIVVMGFVITREMLLRLDLTEDQRFTISEASHRMARELEDPLVIKAYFSAKLPEQYQNLSQQVFDILKEYEASSGGKIRVERHDPDDSQAARGEAENYGIQPVQLPIYEATEVRVMVAYGGIVLLYRDKASEVIDIASRFPQGFEGLSVLEYEITSRLCSSAMTARRSGIAGYLSREAPEQPWQPQRGGPQPEFEGLRRLLGEACDLENVDLKTTEPDPKELPLLLLVRPKEMSEAELFRLDQYLMKGGRVVLFITQGTIEMAQWGDRSFTYKSFRTGLDEWLQAQGVRVPNEFVLHYANASEIPIEREIAPGLRAQMQTPNWFWPVIGEESSLDAENPAIRTLRRIALFWPHPVDILEDRLGEGKKATVLVRSHEKESWRWKDLARVDLRAIDPRADGPSSVSSSPLVVALEGTFTSYFADRPVPPSVAGAPSAAETPPGEEAPEAPRPPEVVKESLEPTQLVVVGNAVFISDAVLGGQQADENAKQATLLAFNLVDWLARSKELIALRAKKYGDRRIQDNSYKSDQEAIDKKFEAREIDVRQRFEELDRAKERQKDRRKRSRWLNVGLPSLVIFVAGLVVWILRASGAAVARGSRAEPRA